MKESNFQRWNQNPLLYHLTNPQQILLYNKRHFCANWSGVEESNLY